MRGKLRDNGSSDITEVIEEMEPKNVVSNQANNLETFDRTTVLDLGNAQITRVPQNVFAS